MNKSLTLNTGPSQWLAELSMAEGDFGVASRLLDEESAQTTRTGNMRAWIPAQIKLAEIDVLLGRPAAARDRLLPFRQWSGVEGGWLLPRLAGAYVELGELDAAEAVLTKATAGPGTMDAFASLEMARIRAMLRTRQGLWVEAQGALEEGLSLARGMPYPYGEARLLHVYGQLHLAKGEPDPAREWLDAALAIFTRHGARADIERVAHLLATLG